MCTSIEILRKFSKSPLCKLDSIQERHGGGITKVLIWCHFSKYSTRKYTNMVLLLQQLLLRHFSMCSAKWYYYSSIVLLLLQLIRCHFSMRSAKWYPSTVLLLWQLIWCHFSMFSIYKYIFSLFYYFGSWFGSFCRMSSTVQ